MTNCRAPRGSHRPPTHPDLNASITSVSSEPPPAIEPSLGGLQQKRALCRHRQNRGSSRFTQGYRHNGSTPTRSSPFTPRRPDGAAPELCVLFRHLSLAADVSVPPAVAAVMQGTAGHVGRQALAAKQLPTLPNHLRASFAKLTTGKRSVRRQILKDVTGAFVPGSMTLLLGRSGSGKSALLKLLSGRMEPDGKRLHQEGELWYNGVTRQELQSRLPQCVSYVPQQDTHTAGLTVKETLEFAYECCAVGSTNRAKAPIYEPVVLPSAYRGGERDAATVMQELGLQRCQNTLVGDTRLRGVSGGEKKRVTMGEMAFGPHAVTLLDEITTGLDSASALDVVSSQRRLARHQRQAVVVALQQPAPELVALFDRILLLADGHVLYHGPQELAAAYFEALGFVCPANRGLADFLCDLASAQQLQYERACAPLPGHRRRPRRANEFADMWVMSPMYEALEEELDRLENDAIGSSHISIPGGVEEQKDDPREALLRVPAFRHGFVDSTWIVLKRQVRLTARNRVFYTSRAAIGMVVGLLFGSLYYQMDLSDAQVAMGVVFSSALFVGLGQAATLGPFFDAREVFYKQRGANFYRTSSYVLASCASQFPLAMLESLLFGSLVYWLTGLLSTLQHFLIYELFMLLTVLVFLGWFFLLAAACPNLHVAQPALTVSLLFFILFAGFAVSRDQLPGILKWFYWADPVAWTVRGILVSQYRSDELDQCVYSDVDYCATYDNSTMGAYSLALFDVPGESKWVVLGLVFLVAIYVGCMLLAYLMLEYCRYEAAPSTFLFFHVEHTPATPVPTKMRISAKSSYALMSTPRQDEDDLLESDLSGVLDDMSVPAEDRSDLILLECSEPSMSSSRASLGVRNTVVPAVRDAVSLRVRPRMCWELPPVTLAFQDLRYSITVPADAAVDVVEDQGQLRSSERSGKSGERTVKRELLRGVTGYAMPGTMTALMGATGAGKTTLLDVLAGRKRGGVNGTTLDGRVMLNGVRATDLAIRRCTGYCEQQDVHCESATFREALQFSAYLRQGDRVASNCIEEMVDECLDLLDLRDVEGQIIRGSSAEQLKRLTVGVELAAQPSVLFLDEPTSGLDALAAKTLMEGVRRVADAGCTVICTIHQPSTEIFLQFDSLLLLRPGGETVYFGDVGYKGRSLVNYFHNLGLPRGVSPFRPGDNPSSWMLDVICAGVDKAASPTASKQRPTARTQHYSRLLQPDLRLRISSDAESGHSRLGGDKLDNVDFVEAYKASRIKQQLDTKRGVPGVFLPSDRLPPVMFTRYYAATDRRQLGMLLQRFGRVYWRTPFYTLTRLVMSAVLALAFGMVFSGENGVVTYQGTNSALGMIHLSVGFLGVGAFSHIVPLVFEERGPFYRERAAETYSPLWYFVASSLVEVPLAAVCGLLFCGIFYPLAGFAEGSDVAQALLYWLVMTIYILFQSYLGQFFAFAMPTVELAAVCGALLDSIMLLFMGFNPPASIIPSGYKWLTQIVPQRYIFQVLVALALGDCPDAQLQTLLADSDAVVDTSKWPMGCQPLSGAPPTVSGLPVTSYVDQVFGARRDDIVRSIAVALGILLLVRVATAIVIRTVNHQRR